MGERLGYLADQGRSVTWEWWRNLVVTATTWGLAPNSKMKHIKLSILSILLPKLKCLVILSKSGQCYRKYTQGTIRKPLFWSNCWNSACQMRIAVYIRSNLEMNRLDFKIFHQDVPQMVVSSTYSQTKYENTFSTG